MFKQAYKDWSLNLSWKFFNPKIPVTDSDSPLSRRSVMDISWNGPK